MIDPNPPIEAGFSLPGVQVLVGDALEQLRTLPDGSVQCSVTSPPYFGLRSYLPDGHVDKAAEIGLEQSPEAYVANLVGVFREVRRVLADDGVLWVVIGDSYAQGGSGGASPKSTLKNDGRPVFGARNHEQRLNETAFTRKAPAGYKPKDLLMIPARVALALQADGWYLRSHCIWAKPNPMPESVRDRPTSAHESVFLLTKRAKYFYDAAAVAEPARSFGIDPRSGQARRHYEGKTQHNADRNDSGAWCGIAETRNLRNVWQITPGRGFPGAHFATFPSELAKRCILAGSKPGDTVLDPFAGSGTTGMVAVQHGRKAVLIELNPEYAGIILKRISSVQPSLIP